MIKYSNNKPPNWEMLVNAAPIVSALWADNLIVTYGDTYYSKIPTTPDLIAHEEVHVEQQKRAGGPDEWWKLWITDINFRLEQELQAYRVQLDWWRNELISVPRNERRFKLRRMEEWIAEILSGEMYGRIVTYKKAMELIK